TTPPHQQPSQGRVILMTYSGISLSRAQTFVNDLNDFRPGKELTKEELDALHIKLNLKLSLLAGRVDILDSLINEFRSTKDFIALPALDQLSKELSLYYYCIAHKPTVISQSAITDWASDCAKHWKSLN